MSTEFLVIAEKRMKFLVANIRHANAARGLSLVVISSNISMPDSRITSAAGIGVGLNKREM